MQLKTNFAYIYESNKYFFDKIQVSLKDDSDEYQLTVRYTANVYDSDHSSLKDSHFYVLSFDSNGKVKNVSFAKNEVNRTIASMDNKRIGLLNAELFNSKPLLRDYLESQVRKVAQYFSKMLAYNAGSKESYVLYLGIDSRGSYHYSVVNNDSGQVSQKIYRVLDNKTKYWNEQEKKWQSGEVKVSLHKHEFFREILFKPVANLAYYHRELFSKRVLNSILRFFDYILGVILHVTFSAILNPVYQIIHSVAQLNDSNNKLFKGECYKKVHRAFQISLIVPNTIVRLIFLPFQIALNCLVSLLHSLHFSLPVPFFSKPDYKILYDKYWAGRYATKSFTLTALSLPYLLINTVYKLKSYVDNSKLKLNFTSPHALDIHPFEVEPDAYLFKVSDIFVLSGFCALFTSVFSVTTQVGYIATLKLAESVFSIIGLKFTGTYLGVFAAGAALGFVSSLVIASTVAILTISLWGLSRLIQKIVHRASQLNQVRDYRAITQKIEASQLNNVHATSVRHVESSEEIYFHRGFTSYYSVNKGSIRTCFEKRAEPLEPLILK